VLARRRVEPAYRPAVGGRGRRTQGGDRVGCGVADPVRHAARDHGGANVGEAGGAGVHQARRRGLYPALRRAQLRRVNMHSLRHSFASALIAAGTPVTEVQHYVGHASPTSRSGCIRTGSSKRRPTRSRPWARRCSARRRPGRDRYGESAGVDGHLVDTRAGATAV